MKITANAKINIGLNVVSKRPDGYHNLETIFYPVDMCDIIEIEENHHDSETHLINTGIAVDSNPQDNLIIKAYNLLKLDFDIPAVNITLDKRVPFGAGLGGGSSDAANTLKALNQMFSLGLTDSQLEDYAVRLGADCPFFIKNKPVFATGIGNEFTPIDLDLSAYKIEIIKPNVSVSTAMAYKGVTPKPSTFNLLNLTKLPIEEWRSVVKNDFEASVFPQFPEIEALKQDFYNRGALYASMSGSGSAVFGVFSA